MYQEGCWLRCQTILADGFEQGMANFQSLVQRRISNGHKLVERWRASSHNYQRLGGWQVRQKSDQRNVTW